MIDLQRYVMIVEGGLAGHMAHPIDYTDFTGNDLVDLVHQLFSGKIEDAHEKLDGTNLSVTMNNNGEVVFIRNGGDLNSPNGGMTINDMQEKWADKPSVANVFVTCGKIFQKVFSKLGSKYFNIDGNTRKIINCECIVAGKTNVILYDRDRVAFHGYKIYKLDTNGKWNEVEDHEGGVDDIYKAADGIDGAKPRPSLVIKKAEDAIKYDEQFTRCIEKLFADEQLSLDSSIEEWKMKRFSDIKPEWIDKDVDKIFKRWFNKDKSYTAVMMKRVYTDQDQQSKLKDDKFAKRYTTSVLKPLDDLFLKIGNAFIDICDGFANDLSKGEIITKLKNDLDSTIEEIKKNGSEDNIEALQKQLDRLHSLGEQVVNHTEGVVLMYKGRRMKLTGSFAPLNAIMGMVKFNKK